MQILPSDWVNLGPGRLYGAPFLSSCLLYRLANCSLLIFQDSNISTHSERNNEGEDFTSNVVVHSGRPERVSIQYAPSATISLRRLTELPATQLDLVHDGGARKAIGRLAVEISCHELPTSKMYMSGSRAAEEQEFKIESAKFAIRSRFAVKKLNTELAADDVAFPCWKISIGDCSDDSVYNMQSEYDWTLTAMVVDETWSPLIDMVLQKQSSNGRRKVDGE